MVNGQHLYSAFIQSAVQLMDSPIHTHQQRLAAMPGTNQLVSSNRGSCSWTLRNAQGGIEPATLRLPDDCSYLLSHLAPKVSTLNILYSCIISLNIYFFHRWLSKDPCRPRTSAMLRVHLSWLAIWRYSPWFSSSYLEWSAELCTQVMLSDMF